MMWSNTVGGWLNIKIDTDEMYILEYTLWNWYTFVVLSQTMTLKNVNICTCLQLQGTCIDNANQAWYASILFANGQFMTNTCKDRSCYMHIYF